ncbi:hypothetical protein FO519_003734 [Halicephalobus sp. NKZ332]|nr:hypothetical protein FO519_003734 [Halicephalobus sp. NKZ332]
MTKDRLTEFNNLNPTYVKILQNGSMVRDRDSDGVSDERNALLTNSGWNDTEQFLKKVSDVTENIEELERLLKEIKNIHKEILKTQEVKPLLIHSVKEVDENIMGLNHLMHPRNVYKDKPPDFKILAQKYEKFRKFAIFSPSGQVSLDFHNPEAVRCLTETLLKEDFNLDVILPKDALVPRIPQRLNYILLIEDLLIASGINDEVVGIDIGTGPSCIFPLLGADHCGWNFCATEINEESMKIAQLNIKNNGLETKVTVIRGHESSFFREVLGSHRETTFCFSMCNPPFFDKEECEAKFQVSEEGEFTNFPGKTEDFRRHGPMSATIAKSSELWVNGGEVAFLTRMIRESQIYRKRIKLFTSLIGKKKSIAPLKRVLDEIRFVFFTSHPISQGKTQRWVLVWTFDPNIKIHKLNYFSQMISDSAG